MIIHGLIVPTLWEFGGEELMVDPPSLCELRRTGGLLRLSVAAIGDKLTILGLLEKNPNAISGPVNCL